MTAAVHPRVAVNTLCLGGSSLAEDCRWARELGVGWITVATAKLDEAGWDAGIRTVRGSGLAVATLVGPTWFTLDDPAGWGAARDTCRRIVDAAAATGARAVYGVTGPPGRLDWSSAAEAYRDAVAPVLDHARSAGVRWAVEPTNPLRIGINLAHSLRDAVELARLAGIDVCVDLYGCFAEARLDQTLLGAADLLALVQVCDFVYGTLDTPNRAVPGDGDLPLERLLGWIVRAGYDGPFDLELNGPRIDAEGHRAATERGVLALSSLLNSLGA